MNIHSFINYGFNRNGVFVDIGGLLLALSYHQVPNDQSFVVLSNKHLKRRSCVSFTFQVDEAKCKASSRPQRPTIPWECSSGDRVLVSFFDNICSHIPLLASFYNVHQVATCPFISHSEMADK